MYTDADRKELLAAAIARSAQRGCSKVVEPDRYPHMGVGCTDGIGRIKADPAKLGYVGLNPCVPRFLVAHAIGAMKVAAHVTGWDSQSARRGDKDMSDVLTNAAFEGECLGGSRGRV